MIVEECENLSETDTNRDNKDSPYSYVSDDLMWREIGLSLSNKGQQTSTYCLKPLSHRARQRASTRSV